MRSPGHPGPVGQWEIVGGIGSRRLKGNYLAVDSLDLF